ncbi:Ribosome biogenesis protein BOP1 homolog [Eumeta japonica]|uniref:Ribosome biogenesis protein BOP1 homolog n=1 Tax=Eumeta variegata TaxID=151549 RepID=A0A4C1X9D3_EUMVA|nr:Ribosome biogenesis protein BOP1 homolog [Eumeta japonica]
MAVHPAGDNLLVASYDRKCMWFDLDLSSKPYQTLRLHGSAVRAVTFHKRYPLFATAGDDHNIIVSHGMVYNLCFHIFFIGLMRSNRACAPSESRWPPSPIDTHDPKSHLFVTID